METYGFIIDKNGEITISGDPFIKSSDTSYQILRSTFFSLLWNKDSNYTLYFVKYPVPHKQYLIYAHTCRQNNTWQQYIVTQFNISYNTNIIDVNKKMLSAMSTDKIWRVSMIILKKTINSNEEYTLTLPSVYKC